MTTPGVEPGLSRPQRDVLTTRRCGPCLLSTADKVLRGSDIEVKSVLLHLCYCCVSCLAFIMFAKRALTAYLRTCCHEYSKHLK